MTADLAQAITVYSHRQSRGRSVLWLLEELGVAYRVEWLQMGVDTQAPAFLAINPMGKIPALTHGEAVLTETPAILMYLADTFAAQGMIPSAGTPARAAFYRWLMFAAGPLEAATTAAFFGWAVPAFTSKGTSGAGFAGFGSLTRTLETLTQHLRQHPYVCGSQVTAADIYLASQLSLGMHYTQAYPPSPVFVEYVERLQARPAFERVTRL